MTNCKKLISILTIAIVGVFASAGISAQVLNHKQENVKDQIAHSSLFNDQVSPEVSKLLDYASTFKGTRYRRGSSSPSGFDCSGFTSYVFKKFGYSLNRSSGGQVSDGVPVAKSDLKPGDLVFFNGRAKGKRVGHVGIVTKVKGNGKFDFIHASCSKGITVTASEEAYYKARYVGACRVVAENKK